MNIQSQDEGSVPVSPAHGMSVLTTAVFIVGEVAGSGVLALPKALNDTGWIGLAVMVLIAVVSTFTGTLLGRCWVIVRQRYPSSMDHEVRQPYPSIGQAAFGKHCRRLVAFCVDFTCFGSTVVFLLLTSENLSELLSRFGVHVSFCVWLMVVTAVLCPLCWLGTPKDFWQIGLTAALATALACLMILTQMAEDAPDMPPAFHGPLKAKDFFAAFGIISFGFGGHQSFPTIQVDMVKPERFGVSLSIAYCTILIIYLPVIISSFLLYGDNLEPNILLSISPGPLLSVAEILITLHLMAGVVILINPVCQESEELLRIPARFGWKRVLFRTGVMGLVLFTALTLPKFGAILSLIGGSTLTCMGFIFPPLFYLKLCSMKGEWDNIEPPLHEKVACVEIILVGMVAGAASTYSAVDSLFFDSNMAVPCYA
ncbi:hypothetical protein RRG08_018752 [Elysia crispata]|uniref:Amino acid transporter transmembrane domain-containing protein n=1 Tax=Elysia crispata TaxID=231223 RepID=A0AAE1DBB7_9GAST|nr:hypothetical protein RRG08_018752 [Elysia crispata]